MAERYRTTSMAYQRDDLRKPSSLDQVNGKVRRAFEQERKDYVTKGTAQDGYERKTSDDLARERRRESYMVKRSQPKPTLKPRGPLAQSVDAQQFNQSWADESRAARKARFKQTRSTQTNGKDRKHERT